MIVKPSQILGSVPITSRCNTASEGLLFPIYRKGIKPRESSGKRNVVFRPWNIHATAVLVLKYIECVSASER